MDEKEHAMMRASMTKKVVDTGHKVVAMPGFSIPRHQQEPIAEVVDICEELLQRAKSGNLRGVAVAMVIAEPQLRTRTAVFSGSSPDKYVMIAAVRMLDYDVSKLAFDDRPNDA